MEKPKRKTTSYGFNVGYVLIATAIFLVVFGMFRGIITSGNVSEILWALLIPAAGFFGITVARAGVAEVATISAGATVATSPPAADTVVSSSGDEVVIQTAATQEIPPVQQKKDVWGVPPKGSMEDLPVGGN